MYHNEPTLESLAEIWLQIKSEITQLTAELHATEAAMIPHLSSNPDGSATTHTIGHKITLKNGVNFSVDQDEMEVLKKTLDARVIPMTTKEVVDTKRLRFLKLNEPRIYQQLSQAITSKPAKPYVKVEVLDD